jgi:hypothetical protein
MKTKQITASETYRNRAGEEFEYAIHRHTLTSEHDYWLYTIQAKHDKWGFRAFGVYATKKAFPTQELAEHLAKTLAVDAMKCRLEQSTAEGFPLVFPLWDEGWWLL